MMCRCAGALALLFGILMMCPEPLRADDLPILFVHGNGDSAALWTTTLWRFESNGYDPSLLFAIDFAEPAAPDDDGIDEPNRSTTTEARDQLADAVQRVLDTTGRAQLALVGSSRGGHAIRNYVTRAGGHTRVAIAILCGTPNHGIFTADDTLGSEWNDRGHFLRTLNAGSETHPDVRFVTIRSDSNDRYAQPPGAPDAFGRIVGTGYDSPALRGATNLVLDGLDHREVAFHPRAFRQIYRVITGREPSAIAIIPEATSMLNGVVSGYAHGEATNAPLRGAHVTVYEADPDTGARRDEASHEATTGATGAWGPFAASPSAYYEFVVTADGYPTTHVFRTPFPRSARYVHLRLEPIPDALDGAESIVTMTRPRGYFGHGRDMFTMSGRVPDGVDVGVPTTSRATMSFPANPGRSVRVVFNDEALTVRIHPLTDGHVVFAEFHY